MCFLVESVVVVSLVCVVVGVVMMIVCIILFVSNDLVLLYCWILGICCVIFCCVVLFGLVMVMILILGSFIKEGSRICCMSVFLLSSVICSGFCGVGCGGGFVLFVGVLLFSRD